MLSSHTVGFQRPDNSNLANLTPGLCSSSWSWLQPQFQCGTQDQPTPATQSAYEPDSWFNESINKDNMTHTVCVW